MRIALLTELFPPSVGGQEVRFAELADVLSFRGHEVHVMCIRHADYLAEHERLSSGVEVVRRPYLPDYRRNATSWFPRSPLGMLRYAIAVRQWLGEKQFDVIFLNQWPLLHVLALTRYQRQRAVIDWCEIRDTQPYRFFQRILPRLVAANTTVSNDVNRHIDLFSSGQVLTLPSGIQRDRYSAGDRTTRAGILYLGRLAPHKGVPMLVAAYEALCRSGCDESLVIAGDGPGHAEVRAAVSASAYSARISLEGMVTEERKQQLLANAKVLVLPSRREGFPRVVAEAMASGLPTVTTRYPGNGTTGVIDEFGCGLCADPTPDAISDAILSVLRDWDVYSAQATAGAERLDWVSVTTEFEQFLTRILEPMRLITQPLPLGELTVGK